MATFNLADLFEMVCDAVPDREAVVSGERRFTYRTLDDRANRLAHHLASVGIGRGHHVGLQLLNGTEYVEGMLACFNAWMTASNRLPRRRTSTSTSP